MTTGTTSARRRLIFLAVLAVAALATLAFTFWGPGGATVATEGDRQTPTGSDTGPVAPEEVVASTPPAYLAWISGGFASDFRDRVRTLDAFTATVVVAGDTRWMTRSTDADGSVVDDPPGAFAFPIDAFAVNPVEYEPFLSDDVRADVIDALDRGEGVLSTRSAALRDIGVGGTMHFGDQRVTIGAVAPDEAIGWSELLVSRDVGDTLGIVDDRYLLALPTGKPGLDRFTDVLTPLVPEGTAIRVEKPGGTPFMRVASGVNPPIVLKQVFGEFAAQPDRRDPAQLTIQPAWVHSHIATRSVPILGAVTCNAAFFPALTRALREVERDAARQASCRPTTAAGTLGRSPEAPPRRRRSMPTAPRSTSTPPPTRTARPPRWTNGSSRSSNATDSCGVGTS